MADDAYKNLHAFCFQLSAQLRGPLTTLQSGMRKIAPAEKREEDPVLDENAALMMKGFYELVRLANHLSEAAEMMDDLPFPMENEDLDGLCRELTAELSFLMELKELTLTYENEGAGELFAAVNRDAVRRLLLNLFSNAMKFTPAGGKITLSLRAEGNTVLLTVGDTGRGISPELLPTLFDRYHHTDRMDPPVHGLGLGLPICHSIAKKHGGELSAVSMEGVGTRVTFSFPRKIKSTTTLKQKIFDYTGGHNPLLVELSDALPKTAFTVRNVD